MSQIEFAVEHFAELGSNDDWVAPIAPQVRPRDMDNPAAEIP